MSSLAPFDLHSDQFQMSVGARPLGAEPLIDLDPASYAAELGLKEQILARDHAYYFQAQPESRAAQWEALALVMGDLARCYPFWFAFEDEGTRWRWLNRQTGRRINFQPGCADQLPYAPLDWLGRQVQEDLLILAGEAEAGFPLVAGQLCFPNHWCLSEKMGLPLRAIHEPVPGYAAQVGRATDLLMERLKPGRPVWRRNWSIVVSAQLNLASCYREQFAQRKHAITPTNAGDHCYFRTERQTLSRLMPSGAILFTIRTHTAPIASLATDPQWAARLLGLLRSTPEATVAYKGMTPFYEALIIYLERAGFAVW